MAEHERVALAIIALITGMMGFIVSMIAVPAASTALAADALTFVQHSVSAGFALRTSTGFQRPRWTVQLQGIVMMLLGGLVCVIAMRRLLIGSFPITGRWWSWASWPCSPISRCAQSCCTRAAS